MSGKQTEFTAILTVTVPANLAANSVVTNCVIQTDPSITGQQLAQVPAQENWVLDDIYQIAGSDLALDMALEIFKNQLTSVLKSAPISSYLVSNPSRPKVGKYMFKGTDLINIRATTLAESDTGGDVVTVYLSFKRFAPLS
jgi:hypothetical protein